MFAISDSVMSEFSAHATRGYNHRLRAWLHQQAELASKIEIATTEWCNTIIAASQRWDIRMEEHIARMARLWLLNGADWLNGQAAIEILSSQRSGELKVFQLECLHRGTNHG
jgi:citrate lyase synthetase